MASRHVSRISVLQALFAAEVNAALTPDAVLHVLEKHHTTLPREDEDRPFSETLIRGVAVKCSEIDDIIKKTAPQWPLEKIAPIDRNILRIGLYELLFSETTSVPPKVALNEAIELAKTFGGESSSRFINGVLGAVYREVGSPGKEEAPRTDKTESEKEYLAGIMVCAMHKGEIYVALVEDPFKKWTLPKTRYEKGELSDGAALRAAQEELGLALDGVTAPLGEHEYRAHDPEKGHVTRRVAYFISCTKKTKLTIGKGENVVAAKWVAEHELVDIELYEDLHDIIASGMVVARERCI